MIIKVFILIIFMIFYIMDLVVWELLKILFCYVVVFEGKLFKYLVKKVGCGMYDMK